ncbi:MAG: tetratricopeptide repeat protein [Flavobacteriales bacterium]|jgi:tetratricopeptide (TPR) repeat protein|nr:tetratricopeptide repeat protein [Flavobacteriales bacterium]
MKKRFFPFILLVLLFISNGCSVKKNKFLNRNYHWVTARYNKCYNAQVLFDKTMESYQNQIKEDYGSTLPIRKLGSEEEAKTLHTPFETVIKKTSEVVQRHSMVIRGEERNNWMDETFLLLGKAYFYRQEYENAAQIFNHGKKYKNLSEYVSLKIWAAETQVMLGNYGIAERQLQEIVETDDLKKKHKIHILETRAELFYRDDQIKKAITALEKTIKYLPNSGDHIGRNFYILGQYALENDQLEEATTFLFEAEKRGKDPILVFNSVLAQTKSFNPETHSASELFASIKKLENNSVYKTLMDQVYYAKGVLHEKIENYDLALENYQNSLDTNFDNGIQLARTHLAKGDLEFQLKNYNQAQEHYDAVMNIIDEKFKNYEQIEQKWKSLSDLAKHYQTIDLNDSLLIVSAWNEDQQYLWAKNRALRELNAQKEKEAEKLATLEKIKSKINLENGKKNINWYFDDKTLIENGKKLFSNVWGIRKLEDNWRRKNKGTINPDEETEITEQEENDLSTTTEENALMQKDSLTEEEAIAIGDLMAKIPNSTKRKFKLQDEIVEAHFALGMIYKEYLKDIPESVNQFRIIVDKYPNSKHKPASYYHLVRLHEADHKMEFANKYRLKVAQEYPESIYHNLLEGKMVKEQEDPALTLYKKAYKNLKKEKFVTVFSLYDEFSKQFEDHKLHPKFKLAVAEAHAGNGSKDFYINSLKDLVKTYPETTEGNVAKKRLNLFLKNKQKNDQKKSIYNESTDDVFFALFLCETSNAQALQSFLSDFSSRAYQQKNIVVSAIIFKDGKSLVSAKVFSGPKDAKKFIELMELDQDYASVQGFIAQPMTMAAKNYPIFYKRKNIQEYLDFEKQYFNN